MFKKNHSPMFTTQELAFLALITAACVVGRLLFQFIPNIQPMTAIFILLTLFLGASRGIIVSILSLIITNIYLGMGVWTITQIVGFSTIVVIAAGLNRLPIFQKHLILQVSYSFIAGFLYGLILALIDTQIYGISNFWMYYLGGVSFDFLHAIGNVGFYLILAPIFKRLFAQYKINQER